MFRINRRLYTVLLIAGAVFGISVANLAAISGEPNKATLIKTSGKFLKLPKIDLPEDTGKDEVEAYCSGCHSLRIVIQQGLSREQWSELLVWMVEEQEMDKLDDEDEKLVLDYLSKHYSVAKRQQRFKRR